MLCARSNILSVYGCSLQHHHTLYERPHSSRCRLLSHTPRSLSLSLALVCYTPLRAVNCVLDCPSLSTTYSTRSSPAASPRPAGATLSLKNTYSTKTAPAALVNHTQKPPQRARERIVFGLMVSEGPASTCSSAILAVSWDSAPQRLAACSWPILAV